MTAPSSDFALSEERRNRLRHTLARPSSARFTLRRRHVDIFYASEMENLPEGCKVLDLGGVRKSSMPGQFNITRYNLDVITLNIQQSANPHVIARAEDLPFPPATFDAVTCSEVLEHVHDPRIVLDEIARVLRPRGRLLLTVPLHYHIHASPHDYGRYTDFFWTETLTGKGFSIDRMEKQGLYWSVLLDFFFLPLNAGSSASRSILWRKFLKALLRWPLTWARRWATARESDKNLVNHPIYAQYTTGYGIVAHLEKATTEPVAGKLDS